MQATGSRPFALLLALLASFALLAVAGACASGGGGGGTSEPAAEQPTDTPPPPGSPLAKVEVGMNDTQVRGILGEPDNANAYITGKSFIPFYYGGDTMRTDWMYRGMGRVVFSRNQWSGALKVVRVIYNPNELQ